MWVIKCKMMKYRYLTLLVIGLALSCGGPREDESSAGSLPETSMIENSLGFDADSLICKEGKVKNGQFFSTLMMKLGMSAQQAYDLTQACGDIFDAEGGQRLPGVLLSICRVEFFFCNVEFFFCHVERSRDIPPIPGL